MGISRCQIRKIIKARLIRRYRSGLIKRRTHAEAVFEDILRSLGLDFILQAGILSAKSFYIVDFYIKSPYKLIIEIDDDNHKRAKRRIYDRKKFSYLRKSGFRLLKFTNEMVLNQESKVKRQLCSCLRRIRKDYANLYEIT
jgi:very-short-patch-repair endonuclease